jgi:hypothetical protein
MKQQSGYGSLIISKGRITPYLRTAKMNNLFATVHDCCVNSIVKSEMKQASALNHK